MKNNELMNTVSRSVHKLGWKFKKYSPSILLGVGIASGVAGTVFACKATIKATKIVEQSKQQLNDIKAAKEEIDKNPEVYEEYTEADYKKDVSTTYAQTAVQLAKVYAPAVALGTVALTAVLASHAILNKRNVALAAAYTVADSAFKEYRGNVKKRFGDEVDKELRFGVEQENVKSVDENGNEVVMNETVDVAHIGVSDFAKFFDEYSPYWKKDPDYNLTFLRQQERWANDKLKANGVVTLNEVYEMLGIPKTQAGMVVGWIYDKNNPVGDNYIDFGIYNVGNEDFVNGHERSILLDFNCDGNIYNLMK